MHDITVWLDEGQSRSACTLSTRSQSTHRLRQVLEERAFALTGAGDGQQVVTQVLLWQEDRHAVSGMTGYTDLPAVASGQLRGCQRCAGASALHIGQVGQVLRLRQVPQGGDIGHTEQMP
jgi:hypothetical protein